MKMRKSKALVMTKKMKKDLLKPSKRERLELVKLSLKRVKSSLKSLLSSKKASGTLI